MSDTSKYGLSASFLKNIALVTMFIDHLGAIVVFTLERVLHPEYGEAGRYNAYFRMIGRLSFIIFAFLLVEGLIYTSDRKKHLIWLLAGAAVSEIPFDLAESSKVFDPWYQNIFFTLSVGFAVIWALDVIRNEDGRRRSGSPRGRDEGSSRNSTDRRGNIGCIPAQALVIAAGLIVSELIRCDYGCMGVGLIIVFYYFRWNRLLFFAALAESFIGFVITDSVGVFAGRLMRSTQTGTAYQWPTISKFLNIMAGNIETRLIYNIPWTAAALLLILWYNGEKGRGLPKLFYYLFYPAHLLLLSGAVWWIMKTVI